MRQQIDKIKMRKVKIMNYTYMVRCRDGSLYTGWTNHLEERVRAHNEGNGAKYTKSRTPVRLVYYEEYDSKIDAMKREYAIKQLSKREKEMLVEAFDRKECCKEKIDDTEM